MFKKDLLDLSYITQLLSYTVEIQIQSVWFHSLALNHWTKPTGKRAAIVFD